MKIGGIIRGWYKKNQRELPMRRTRDPYKIWIAEVIFQQTRINQGLDYYLRFLEAFPDVAALARASEDEVLKLWQGLGYYSRARNLQSAARTIMEQMNGQIPDSYDGLLKLKGVGKYTAAAIASFCYGEARAAVDGNVSRVIARVFGVEQPVNTSAGSGIIEEVALQLLDRDDPGNHNQAMIDFGALQCLPVSPDCTICPLQHNCEARRTNRVDQLPVKTAQRKPVPQWFYYYIIICNGETVLTKRGTEGIWRSLYQFPVLESEVPCSEQEVLGGALQQWFPDDHRLNVIHISQPVKHQLTHRTLHATFIHIRLEHWPKVIPEGWIRISLDSLDDFPVPRLINRYMEVVNF